MQKKCKRIIETIIIIHAINDIITFIFVIFTVYYTHFQIFPTVPWKGVIPNFRKVAALNYYAMVANNPAKANTTMRTAREERGK